MNNKPIYFLLFLLLPFIAFSKNVINSGHQAPVKFIEYLDSEKSFFSLSEDGTLVIKKADDEKISKRFFITSNSISQMILSEDDRLAVVENDSASKFIISVWNWKLEKKLYSINLDEFPMTIGFSGSGNYIYVSSISSQPVRVFNARTGASTTYLNKNESYIDFIYIGSSEKTAYLYSSTTGTLDIRYLNNSKLIKSIKTVKNLTDITLTMDKKFIIGKKDKTIYIIGRNDGKIYDKKEISDLNKIKLNTTTGELICYINNRYKKSVKTLQIISGSFFDSSKSDVIVKNPIDIFSSEYNKIVYADSLGNIDSYNYWSKESSNFLTNNLININDVTIIDDTGVLLTSDTIVLFKSPFFSDKIKNSKRLTDFDLSTYNSPLKSPIGSRNLNGNLLLWNDSLVLFDITTGETLFNFQFSSEIVDVKVRNNRLLVLDKNGLVKIIDLEKYSITFSFKSPGFTSVGFFNENEIIGGVDISHGGSIMVVDLKTKETLPLKTSLDVVFNILESDKDYIIYITGIKNVNGTNNTYLNEFNLLTNRERVLIKNSQEELYSNFEVDDKNIIYTNLGTKSLIKVDPSNRRIKPFQITINQTNSIISNNGAIYTVNENKSLSIWSPTTGRKIIDFYLFKDNEWVAITPDSVTAFGSPNSKKYISIN
ncbi:hypothetical protein EW093_15995 [Thiospirochaeta perfilievii]|uniref:WD40 repeat domain-containing protein n=1 Tax=Thiospirochaeta perfilievii TaxID=252967 RepID=A0A5C1QHV6_9SPIO|nr:hypothetical protein [Thiospirochaeta perfilievii]QEN06124.1 hypothetical protein EW093_15995 [Thiospirochaeta perfilievii]